MAKVGKFEEDKLMAVMKTGFIKKHRQMPEQVIEAASKPAIGVFPAIIQAALAIIPKILEIIGKIIGIFKKKKDKETNDVIDSISAENVSDLTLLQPPVRTMSIDNGNGGSF